MAVAGSPKGNTRTTVRRRHEELRGQPGPLRRPELGPGGGVQL